MYIVDLGEERNNLSIESINALDKALVNGVPLDFEVSVKNYSKINVKDIDINFTSKSSLPLKRTINYIEPGATETVQFTYNNEDINDVSFVPIEISLSDNLSSEIDVLRSDNKYFFSAAVTKGIKTLIVDGDPSGLSDRGESFYLANALAPGACSLRCPSAINGRG